MMKLRLRIVAYELILGRLVPKQLLLGLHSTEEYSNTIKYTIILKKLYIVITRAAFECTSLIFH